MKWELYEVWAEDAQGHDELIDTTKSIKEAKSLAQSSLTKGFISAKIFRETDEGDFDEVGSYKSR